MFKTGILAAGVIAIVTNAHADPDTAKRMLAASKAAIRDAKSMSFVLKVEAKGMVSVVVDGNVKMQRQAKSGGRWIARLDGTSSLAYSLGDEDTIKIPYDIVIDGEYYTWIDHE